MKPNSTEAKLTSSGKVQLELYLDAKKQYPASLECSVPFVSESVAGQQALVGELEINKSSAASWMFAVFVAVLIMLVGIGFFLLFVSIGVQALKDNAKAYSKGINEFIDLGKNTFQRLLPESMWARETRNSQKQPGEARRTQEDPGGSMRTQEDSGGPRKARRSQDEQGGARRSQKKP